jgi:hypothetical protein
MPGVRRFETFGELVSLREFSALVLRIPANAFCIIFCSINAPGSAPTLIRLGLFGFFFPRMRAIFCERIGFGCPGIPSRFLAGAIESIKDRRASGLLESPIGTSLKLNYDGCKIPFPT